MVNFHKNPGGLAQTSWSNGIFNTMWHHARYLGRGAGWGRRICYLGASCALSGELSIKQWENCNLCILFISILVVFFSLCCSIKLFLTQPMSFCLFLLILLPILLWRGEWESNCVVLCCRLGLNHNTDFAYQRSCFGGGGVNEVPSNGMKQ